MKTFNTLLFTLMLCTFFSCGKDEVIVEATFAEKYQGDWRMATTGDLEGTYNFTVAGTPGTFEVTSYSISGDFLLSTEFQCTMTVDGDGVFTIDLDSNVLTQRGTFDGTLDESGTGSGNYAVVGWDVDNFSEYPLNGPFTLEKL